jgi:hypothetical protein
MRSGKVDFNAINMTGYDLFIGDPVSKMMFPVGGISKTMYV